MKIFIKNLRGDKTEVEIQESESILSIKERLNTLQGHTPDLQKLILAGKILEDHKSASESGIQEGSTIVLMVSKPKPQAKLAEVPPPMPSTTGPSSSLPPRVIPPPGPPAAADVPDVPQELEGPSALLTGNTLSSTINSIIEMGFDRKDVEAAMKAAFNNPDRAIEYLTSGLPAPSNPVPPQQGNPSDEQFRQLLQDPMFMQLLAMIQQNPAALAPILTQLQQSNPEVYNLITNNREAFMRLLQESPAPRIDPNMVAGLPRPPPPGSVVITLSQEEQQSIKNLMELGFSKDDAIEAYLTCDKNEAHAASMLFDNYQPVGVNSDFIMPDPDSGEQ